MSDKKYNPLPGDSRETQLLNSIANEIRSGFKDVNESITKTNEYINKAVELLISVDIELSKK